MWSIHIRMLLRWWLGCPITKIKRTSQLLPWKSTWNQKMEVWEMIFLFKGVIFTFHVFPCQKISGKRKFFMKPFSEGEPGSLPIGSMYGIFTYIYHKNQPNVVKYTIHGSYGLGFYPKQKTTLDDWWMTDMNVPSTGCGSGFVSEFYVRAYEKGWSRKDVSNYQRS